MKKSIILSACLLTVGAIIFTGCKKDDEEVPIVVAPTPTVPKSSNVVLHLPLNGNANAAVGTATTVTNTATYVSDRKGTANGAAYLNGAAAAGTGQIIELSGGNFIPSTTTVSCWYKIDPSTFGPGSRIMFGVATDRGYFLEVAGDQAWCKFATSHRLNPDPNAHYYGTAWTDPNGDGNATGNVVYDYLGSLTTMLGGTGWHQMVMTYDEVSAIKTLFVDGVKVMQVDLNSDASNEWHMGALKIADQAGGTGAAISGIVSNLTLGYFCSASNTATGWSDYATSTNTWQGSLDDFRIWNVALSESEVLALYNFEK